ncbi:iron-sulfur cluster assembly scaffold protein [Chloroflexota bacterium]
MSTDFEKLQELFLANARNIYSETVINHAMNSRNAGNIESADGYASVIGSCGDTMEIWLQARDNTIIRATFMTDGCGATIAAGSMVTELAKGKNIFQAFRITQQDILKALDGLPKENQHCALLAANTLKEAIRDYLDLKKEPWKKAYRKV